jgi:arsenical pump membrane protein
VAVGTAPGAPAGPHGDEPIGAGLGVQRGRFRHLIRYQYAPAVGVLVLVIARVMGASDLRAAVHVMWRPLLIISSIMLITAGAQRLGVLDRIAAGLFARARGSVSMLFSLTFGLSAVTAALLNNDSAVLLLIPIVVALVRLLYPDRPTMVVTFALVVFMAAGVAPFVVSNPMNLIVATYAGMNFNTYAAHMIPVAFAGWIVTFVALRWLFRRELALAPSAAVDHPPEARWTAAQGQGLVLLLLVMGAYPVVAYLHRSPYVVAVPGALAFLLLCWRHRAGDPVQLVRTGVAWDILVFLAGVSAVAIGLDNAGLVSWLGRLYQHVGMVGIGVTSAAGSALINTHPMSLLNILAIHPHKGIHLRPTLAALIGGDLGPRLLPWGSLAGLLWFASLRHLDVEVSVRQFVKVGAFLTLVSLPVSLLVLFATS